MMPPFVPWLPVEAGSGGHNGAVVVSEADRQALIAESTRWI